MILIVGLGNSGKKFEKTRHNVGFRAIQEFKEINHFPDFKLFKKFNAQISEGFLKEEITLVKPQTFMNNSGQSVKLLVKRYTLNPKKLIVIHDDIDLPLGKIRISIGRSSAGHKGVQSIINEIKTKDFIRFRIGIKPREKEKETEKFVLKKFRKDEEKILKETIEKIVQAIEITVKEDVEKSMAKFN